MRVRRRIVAAAGAGVAVALLVVGGVAVSRIAADPTPAPTAVPTPVPTPSMSPLPSKTPAVSAPRGRKDWSVEVDDAECLQGPPGNPVSLEARLRGLEGRQVDWLLLKDGMELAREQITVRYDEDMEDAYHELTVSTPSVGRYVSRLILTDDQSPLLTTRFRLLDCVRTELRCHTIRFFNPAANPAVKVRYQPTQDADDAEVDANLKSRTGVRDRGVFRLGPGEVRDLTTYRHYVLWEAWAPKDAHGERTPAGEDYAHVIPQNC